MTVHNILSYFLASYCCLMPLFTSHHVSITLSLPLSRNKKNESAKSLLLSSISLSLCLALLHTIGRDRRTGRYSISFTLFPTQTRSFYRLSIQTTSGILPYENLSSQRRPYDWSHLRQYTKKGLDFKHIIESCPHGHSMFVDRAISREQFE